MESASLQSSWLSKAVAIGIPSRHGEGKAFRPQISPIDADSDQRILVCLCANCVYPAGFSVRLCDWAVNFLSEIRLDGEAEH